MPYLDYLAGEEIRSAAREAVRKVIQEQNPLIESAIRDNLKTDNIATAVAKAFIEASTQDWKIEVNFKQKT